MPTTTCYRQAGSFIQPESGWTICETYKGLCCLGDDICLDEQMCHNPKASTTNGSGYYIGLCTVCIKHYAPNAPGEPKLTPSHRTRRTTRPPAPRDAPTTIGETSRITLPRTCGPAAGRPKTATTRRTRRSSLRRHSSCSRRRRRYRLRLLSQLTCLPRPSRLQLHPRR